MAITFKSTSIRFDPTSGIVQNEPAAVVFGSRVNRAEVALNGFDIKFTDGDHPVFQQIIDAKVDRIERNTVFVSVDLLLRDHSGNIDDRFQGRVDLLVIADVA